VRDRVRADEVDAYVCCKLSGENFELEDGHLVDAVRLVGDDASIHSVPDGSIVKSTKLLKGLELRKRLEQMEAARNLTERIRLGTVAQAERANADAAQATLEAAQAAADAAQAAAQAAKDAAQAAKDAAQAAEDAAQAVAAATDADAEYFLSWCQILVSSVSL
jgi:hypothetical protein